MTPRPPNEVPLGRRELFQHAGMGLGTLALTSLLNPDLFGAPPPPKAGKPSPRNPLAERPSDFFPQAKNVIFLHMVGAPSQLDLLEHKPALNRHDRELVPKHFIEGQRFAFLRGHPKLMGSPFSFARHGKAGHEISQLLPHLGGIADDIAVVKTLQTSEFNHAPAQLFFQTGFSRFGRPSLGAWVTYGLGTSNANLPAFVVLPTGKTAGAGNSLWGSGFLPTVYQGVEFRRRGEPVLFLTNPAGVQRSDRRRVLDALGHLNSVQLADVGDPSIATRIAQYETAFRMQMTVPELTDLSSETRETHELYGTEPGKSSFANNCLLARRLVERGVRFVQLYDSGWDHHGSLASNLESKCAKVDRAAAALVTDLKRRGLLDETLVIWGGEFGRTPMLQGNEKRPGRDHHKDAFCCWLAGGGVRAGTVYGKTDELGYLPVENPLPVNDFHATVLHLLGLDHEQLTFKFQGRDFRLTDVAGEVATGLLA